MRNRVWSLSIIVILLLPAGMPAAAQDQSITVIASTSILADVARSVAGDAASVGSLFPLGADAHTAEPSAQDVARLSDADLVLVVGANYEGGLLPVLEQAGGSNVVTVSECVPIRPVTINLETSSDQNTGTPTAQPSDGNTSALDTLCAAHADVVKAAFGLDEVAAPGALGPLYTLSCGADHAVGGCDPHVWTDPANVALWALMIRDTLIERDPAHADTYQANTEAYLSQLVDTDQQIKTLTAAIPENRRYLLTNHLAFGYFAARYGLTIVGVIIPGGSTTSEPSVQDMMDLIQTVQDYQVPAIFTENVASNSLAKQIADQTGAKMVSLYTESLGDSGSGADTYLHYILFDASAIADALK
jgi:manganese/iron transport system substrate-binding protein